MGVRQGKMPCVQCLAIFEVKPARGARWGVLGLDDRM